jgi:hypothetical protein
MTEKQKKRKDLTIKEKVQIIEKYDKLPKMGQRNASVQLKIYQPLLCKILKSRDKILSGAKQNENSESMRKRVGKDEEVECALKLWFRHVGESTHLFCSDIVISRLMLSHFGWPKVITLSGAYCSTKRSGMPSH